MFYFILSIVIVVGIAAWYYCLSSDSFGDFDDYDDYGY